MTHPRALTEQEAIEAEQWFTDYERVGTFEEKARELGVAKDTLRDAIRRVRKQNTRVTREKLSTSELVKLVELVEEAMFHEEPRLTEEEDLVKEKTG